MTETLAGFSNNAMYFATIIYALAMVAHITEWAFARQLPADARLPVHEPVEATASRSAAGSAARAATYPTGRPSDPISVPPEDLTSAPPHSAAPRESEVERSDRFGRIGLSLTLLGLLLHAVGVACRGLAASRVPWGSMYEFAITGSLAVAVAYVFLVRRYATRWLGLLVTAFLVTVLGVAVILLYRPVAPLVPALHSYWLVIHVSAAAVAGGAFTVGALTSVLFLLRSRLESQARQHPEVARTGFLWRTPSAEAIDRIAYRVHAFAFPLWTFAVLAGAIWAQYAWGRFWGWDPKEVWAFITWVVYAAYLHARATAGWQGRAAAYVALLGFATFLFNFVGINLLGSGLHAYSGM